MWLTRPEVARVENQNEKRATSHHFYYGSAASGPAQRKRK